MEAVRRPGEGSEDGDRGARPVPALVPCRPAVERGERNEVAAFDKAGPRLPGTAPGRYREVRAGQSACHRGRDEAASGEIAPGCVTDLEQSLPGIGKSDEYQAVDAEHPFPA